MFFLSSVVGGGHVPPPLDPPVHQIDIARLASPSPYSQLWIWLQIIATVNPPKHAISSRPTTHGRTTTHTTHTHQPNLLRTTQLSGWAHPISHTYTFFGTRAMVLWWKLRRKSGSLSRIEPTTYPYPSQCSIAFIWIFNVMCWFLTSLCQKRLTAVDRWRYGLTQDIDIHIAIWRSRTHIVQP